MSKKDVIQAINDLTGKIQAEGISDVEYPDYLQALRSLEDAVLILKKGE